MTLDTTLHTRYRPTKFADVVGHDAVVRSIRQVLLKKSSRAFLFTGSSGVGKTTLARIVAAEVGCGSGDLVEVDAATHTGIDAMRAVQDMMEYRPIGGGVRAILIDECFAGGTLVDTPTGPVAIETLHPGDLVLGVTGTQTVRRVMRRSVSFTRIVKLRLFNGSVIVCSKEHPFLTNQGWVVAGELSGKSVVVAGRDGISYDLYEVWDRIYEQRSRSTLVRKVLHARMCGVWQKICEEAEFTYCDVLARLRKQVSWEQTLWSAFAGTSKEAFGGTAQSQKKQSRFLAENRSANFCENEKEQPGPYGWSVGESAEYQAQSWVSARLERRAWGQWSWSYEVAVVVTLACRWALGASNYLWKRSWKWMANLLQGRHWFSRATFGRRGGWQGTSVTQTKGSGSEKDAAIKVVGMDDYSVLERTDFGIPDVGSAAGTSQITCYDLEIVEHPSFCVAGGLIAHNCQALSKSAFQSMLKVLEEPPSWAFWLLCTTEPSRVPVAIVTRCTRYDLKPVAQSVLIDLLDGVAVAEKMSLSDDKIIGLCAREAGGSPRQALVNLALCAGAKTAAEARELLRSAEQSRDAVELARALVRGAKWPEVQGLLRDLSDTSPESIRHVVRAYVTKVVMGANSEKSAARGMCILDAFSEPCAPQDGISPIVLACGHVVLGG